MINTKIIYLICNTSIKEPKALYAVDDKIKAEHWSELLGEQGIDAKIITIDHECLDSIDSLMNKSTKDK